MSATISENALSLFKKRYLQPNETVDGLFHRISGGDAQFYDLFSSLDFLPNSPAIANANTGKKGTVYACFHFSVGDSMHDGEDSIMHTRYKASVVAKWGGGVGYYLGNLRPKNHPINTVHRKACGACAVIRDYNALRDLITQGGMRDLAQLATFPSWHQDIEEYIDLKKDNESAKKLSSFNISVSWEDDPMKEIAERKPGRNLDLFNKQVDKAWRTGCPGAWYRGTVNRLNPTPYLGPIEGCNPCTVGSTLLLTNQHGNRRIDSLVGEEVEVWNGKEWSKVTPRVTGYNQDIYRVTLDNGKYLDCTAYHGFYLIDGIKVEASDLSPGDLLEEQNVYYETGIRSGEVRVVSVEYLNKKDTVYCFTEPKEGKAVFNGILTAQCGEVDLYSDEPCDIGSLKLSNFVTKNRTVNYTRLYERARIAQRYLDYLHDINFIPVPEIMLAAQRTRKTGVGVMAWADMLCLMHIHYDTVEAVDLAHKVMGCINQAAYDESIDLAKKKGPFPGYDADKATTPPIRNSTRTCIAPTGTIYLLSDCDSSGIEPHFLLETERKTFDGMILREKVKAIDESGGFIPKTANDIHWKWHVRHQAAFQKSTDLAVSKSVNLPESATREDVFDAYVMMWKEGCKGGTIYRNNCRDDQVLVEPGRHKKGEGFDTTKLAIFLPDAQVYTRRKMPSERASITHKFKVDGTECFITVGLFEDGKPGEFFMRASRMGSTIGGILDTWAITFSLALQSGTPLESLCKHHIGTRFEPYGITDNPNIPICTSIPDYVVRWLESKFLLSDNGKGTSVDSGIYCPDCGKQAIYQSGCLTCINCGWSKCG